MMGLLLLQQGCRLESSLKEPWSQCKPRPSSIVALLVLLCVAGESNQAAAASPKQMEAAIAKKYKDLHHIKQKEASFSSGNRQFSMPYLDALPRNPQGTVVFFHGSVFTAKTWQITGVLDILYAKKFRSLAPDLPTGNMGADVAESMVTGFLKAVDPPADINSELVIVAASHGGSFALPYVWNQAAKVSGYISIAADHSYLKGKRGNKDVPLLTIYGSYDPALRGSDQHRQYFSKWQNILFQDAPHQCYLKDVAAAKYFSRLVMEFVKGEVTNELKIVARIDDHSTAIAHATAATGQPSHPETVDAGLGGFVTWHWLVVVVAIAMLSLLYVAARHAFREAGGKDHDRLSRVVGRAGANTVDDAL